MIANLSKGNILLLQVDNGLDYEDKNKEAKQMQKETAILNVVKNAVQAKNAGFEKATITFNTQNEMGDREYSTYYVNIAQNGNVALSPKDKDKNPTIWIKNFGEDDYGRVGYGFSKDAKGDGNFGLSDKVAAFLDSVEVKEVNGKSYVGVNVTLNNANLKKELLAAQENGQRAYAVIKNNGEIRIEQGIPKDNAKDNAKQETQEQAQNKAQTIGNPNRQKQSDMER